MAGEGIILNTWAGASVTVGEDQIQNELLAVQPMARRITKVALVGSTAAGDTTSELVVNGRTVATLQNTSTGVDINHNTDVLNVDFFVGANSRVQLFCRAENAGANDLVAMLQFAAPKSSGRSYNRRRSYSSNRRTYRKSGMR